MTYKYGTSAVLPRGYELTKARSERIALVVDGIRTGYERATNYNIKRTFRNLQKAILSYDELTEADLNKEMAKCRVQQEQVLTTIYGRIADDTKPLILEEQVIKSADKTDTEQWRILIDNWIRENVAVHVRYIDETTRADLHKLFLQADTTVEYRTLIEPYFRTSAPTRSYTIARTETAHATNGTMAETMRQVDTGRDKITIWNAWRDERTRQSHLQMADKTVPYGQLFRVPNAYGGIDRMEYPLDSSHGATPGNIINCRCFQSWKYV